MVGPAGIVIHVYVPVSCPWHKHISSNSCLNKVLTDNIQCMILLLAPCGYPEVYNKAPMVHKTGRHDACM